MANIFEEVIRSVILGLDVPFLESPPGWGKNAIAAAVARSFNARLLTVYLAQRAGDELHGQPVVRKEPLQIGERSFVVVEQAPPRQAIESAMEAGYFLLFFDELNHLSPADMLLAASILSERSWGDVKLPLDKVVLMGAGNPPKFSVGSAQMPLPLMRRVTRIPLHIDAAAFSSAECFPSNWGQPLRPGKVAGHELDDEDRYRQRSLLAGWVHANPGVFEMQIADPTKMADGFVSPATLENAADLMSSVRQNVSPAHQEEARSLVLRGKLGAVHGDAVAAYLDNLNVPDSRQALDDVAKFTASEHEFVAQNDKLYYFMLSLIEECRFRTKAASGSDKRLRKAQTSWVASLEICAYLLRRKSPTDFVCMLAHNLVGSDIRPPGVPAPAVVCELQPLIDLSRSTGCSWTQLAIKRGD